MVPDQLRSSQEQKPNSLSARGDQSSSKTCTTLRVSAFAQSGPSKGTKLSLHASCPERAWKNNSSGLHFRSIIASLLIYSDLTFILILIHIRIILASLICQIWFTLLVAQSSLLIRRHADNASRGRFSPISFPQCLVFFVSHINDHKHGTH
jgi:hypothetical protein